MHDVLNLREMLADEIVQRRESGYDVEPLSAAELVTEDPDELEALLRRVEGAARAPDWPYDEPEGLDAILAACPAAPAPSPLPPVEELRDRVLGAWLARCAGCVLGKPVENWPRDDLRRFLDRAGAYPLRDYVPADGPAPPGFPALNVSWPSSVRGRIDGMPRDDDTDYTILGLHVLETYGTGFTTGQVAQEWLRRFPFLTVYTAERAAYRNLIGGLSPPATATDVNPYREWIGAQIRVDAYAYAAAGDPAAAARMAHVDATLSHTANGVYAAMWAAALIAASFVEPTMRDALDRALAVVPPASRLAEALRDVAAMHAGGSDWESARDFLEERYGELSPVHSVNNASVVAAALLWGEGDASATLGLAVQGGWDTDCNGATAGSAFGAMHGAGSLPEHWTAPLRDRIHSALFGFDGVRISDLAERTVAVLQAART